VGKTHKRKYEEEKHRRTNRQERDLNETILTYLDSNNEGNKE